MDYQQIAIVSLKNPEEPIRFFRTYMLAESCSLFDSPDYLAVAVRTDDRGTIFLEACMWFSKFGRFQLEVNHVTLETAIRMAVAGAQIAERADTAAA